MDTVIWVVPALVGVFDEFLDDGGGAFDDFAGGCLRCDGRLRYLDVHGSSWSAEQGAAGKKLTTPLGWLGVSVETVGTVQWWEILQIASEAAWMALWTKFGASGAGNETGCSAVGGGRRCRCAVLCRMFRECFIFLWKRPPGAFPWPSGGISWGVKNGATGRRSGEGGGPATKLAALSTGRPVSLVCRGELQSVSAVLIVGWISGHQVFFRPFRETKAGFGQVVHFKERALLQLEGYRLCKVVIDQCGVPAAGRGFQ